MVYQDYQRHLLDVDPAAYSAAPCDSAVGVPVRDHFDTQHSHRAYTDSYVPPSWHVPTAPPYAQPWVLRPDLQSGSGRNIPPHQQSMARATARDHGRRFKHDLQACDLPGVVAVRRLLKLGRPWWHKLGLGTQTVGVLLQLQPTRVVVTPEGFFIMAKPPAGLSPGRLAPLCSANFATHGTPDIFMRQVESELNGILRRRAEIWQDLLLFAKPQKKLHACRSAECDAEYFAKTSTGGVLHM